LSNFLKVAISATNPAPVAVLSQHASVFRVICSAHMALRRPGKNKVRDGSSRNAISLWLELDFMKRASFMFGEEEWNHRCEVRTVYFKVRESSKKFKKW